MAPNGLATLAPELVEHVVKKAFEVNSDHAERASKVWRDLLNLASTCRYLRNVVTPMIYRQDAEISSSALTISTKTNNIAGMRMALSHGAEIHAGDRSTAILWNFDEPDGRESWIPLQLADQATPLHWAAIKGHTEAMTLLLQHENVDVNHRVRVDTSLGRYRSSECRSRAAKFREIFPFPSKPVEEVAAYAMNRLWAIEYSIILEILEKGANALYFAVMAGDIQMAKLLIGAGSSFTTHLGTEVTALHQACQSGNIQMVELMLGHVDPSVEDAKGNTPLHCLPEDSQLAEHIIDLLLERGADINARDGEGEIPIHSYFFKHRQSWSVAIAAFFIRRGSLIFDDFFESFGAEWPSCQGIIYAAIDDANTSGFEYDEEIHNPMFHERNRHINLWFYERYTGWDPDIGLRVMNNWQWAAFWGRHLQDVTGPPRVLCGGLIVEGEDEQLANEEAEAREVELHSEEVENNLEDEDEDEDEDEHGSADENEEQTHFSEEDDN